MNRTANDAVANVELAQCAVGSRIERQAFVPITSAVATVGCRHRVSVNYDNHDHIQEVLNDNNGNRGFPP